MNPPSDATSRIRSAALDGEALGETDGAFEGDGAVDGLPDADAGGPDAATDAGGDAVVPPQATRMSGSRSPAASRRRGVTDGSVIGTSTRGACGDAATAD